MRLAKPVTCCLFLLVAAAATLAADPEAKKNPVPAGGFAVVKIKMEKGDSVAWEVTPEPEEVEEFERDGYAYVHFSGTADKYRATADVVNFDTKKRYKKRIDVSFAQNPKPPPVIPPVDPKVDPVTPKPAEGNPFAATPNQLKVMVAFDEDQKSRLTEEQKAIMYGADVRAYIASKSTLPPERQDAGRFWPKTTDVAAAAAEWQKAFARAKDKMGDAPMWMIVSGGGKWEEGKPPATAAEMLALLKRYGG